VSRQLRPKDEGYGEQTAGCEVHSVLLSLGYAPMTAAPPSALASVSNAHSIRGDGDNRRLLEQRCSRSTRFPDIWPLESIQGFSSYNDPPVGLEITLSSEGITDVFVCNETYRMNLWPRRLEAIRPGVFRQGAAEAEHHRRCLRNSRSITPTRHLEWESVETGEIGAIVSGNEAGAPQ
jgi:hypothetical protein